MNPRPHPITIFLFPATVATGCLFVLGFAHPPFFFLAAIPWGRRWLLWRSQTFEVTPTTVKMGDGVFIKDQSTLAVRNISSVQVRQGIAGRILGYGDLLILANGQTGLVWSEMRDPQSVADYLESVVTR